MVISSLWLRLHMLFPQLKDSQQLSPEQKTRIANLDALSWFSR
jgi:hypothetical protein